MKLLYDVFHVVVLGFIIFFAFEFTVAFKKTIPNHRTMNATYSNLVPKPFPLKPWGRVWPCTSPRLF